MKKTIVTLILLMVLGCSGMVEKTPITTYKVIYEGEVFYVKSQYVYHDDGTYNFYNRMSGGSQKDIASFPDHAYYIQVDEEAY